MLSHRIRLARIASRGELARRAQYHQSVLVGHVTPLDAGFRQMLQGTA